MSATERTRLAARRGQRAYRARARDCEPWRAIAARYGFREPLWAREAAEAYAASAGLAWPPRQAALLSWIHWRFEPSEVDPWRPGRLSSCAVAETPLDALLHGRARGPRAVLYRLSYGADRRGEDSHAIGAWDLSEVLGEFARWMARQHAHRWISGDPPEVVVRWLATGEGDPEEVYRAAAPTRENYISVTRTQGSRGGRERVVRTASTRVVEGSGPQRLVQLATGVWFPPGEAARVAPVHGLVYAMWKTWEDCCVAEVERPAGSPTWRLRRDAKVRAARALDEMVSSVVPYN